MSSVKSASDVVVLFSQNYKTWAYNAVEYNAYSPIGYVRNLTRKQMAWLDTMIRKEDPLSLAGKNSLIMFDVCIDGHKVTVTYTRCRVNNKNNSLLGRLTVTTSNCAENYNGWLTTLA